MSDIVPLVSVCIAAYNHEEYVGQAIESVLAQSYCNIEILIADDASSDGTAAIIQEFARLYPERVRALLLEKNEGPSRTANALFAIAKGEFIAFLGSDDRMLPQRIERQVAYLLANPNCVGVLSEITVIDSNGLRPAGPTGYEELFNQPITHLRRQLLTGNFLNAPSALVRRTDLLAVGGYDPLLRYVQDFDLWGRLLVRGDLDRLPARLTEYRVHGSNMSIPGQGGPSFAARCETVEAIVRFVRQWSLESLVAKLPQHDGERASALLELATVLQLVDRKFLAKPSLGCAYAYEIVLQAGRLNPLMALDAKRQLECILENGFDVQWKPWAWHETGLGGWFVEPRAALGDSTAPCKELTSWLGARTPSIVQSRFIDNYLHANSGGPDIVVVVLDLSGNSEAISQTIESLGAMRVRSLILSTGIVRNAGIEDRLHVVQVDADNYIHALNVEIRQMEPSWVMIVQAGEIFTPFGLLIARLELVSDTDCVAVFGDELQQLPNGDIGATFRPAFNLDLLLSLPAAMARHWLFRSDVLIGIGGFNECYSEAMEFELLLRLIDVYGLNAFGHISEPFVVANASELKDRDAERVAIEQHLLARGYPNAKLMPHLPGRYRINYNHADRPLVSIVVPTKDQLSMLLRCVESLLEKTAYTNYEILIVDNNSEDSDALAWFAGMEAMGDDKVRILRYPHPFNYSAINNMAAYEARGEYLVLLNNDTAVISESWLDELLNHAQRPEVGIVGAKLLYPNGRIQHAGVVLGLCGPAEHVFIDEPMDSPGYMYRLQVDQNYSAVTAACLMVRKTIYHQVGGLDESLTVSYNDVDFCLKVRQAGYLLVWTPHAVVMHEGSVSQTRVDTNTPLAKRKRFVSEQDAMYYKWLPQLARDPAYNPNLSLVQTGGFKLKDAQTSWRPLDSWRPLPVVLAHPGDMMGCGHYRVIQPFSALREAGMVDGEISAGLMHVVDLERYNPDAVVLQRQIGEERLEAMRRMKAFSKAFKVYELDDYLPNLPMKSVHRSQMPKDIVKSLRRGLSYVDRFVVSTEVMAEAFADFHHDIRVVKNRLDPRWWCGLPASTRRASRKPRVGWAGGSSHTGDLEMIADVVKELAEEVEWVFFGMCPEKLKPYVHEFHEGVAIERYASKLATLDLDLALAPVEQNLFNECKSNLRLLEYGACGFPVVCSDVRCYQGDGLPVTRVKNRFRDWVEAIRGHINDIEAAGKAGDELRIAVLNGWMLDDQHLEAWRAAWLPD